MSLRSAEVNKKPLRPPRTTPRKWAERLSFAGDDQSNNNNSDTTSVKSSATTPTSVLINGIPLTKDLSDLSGSYMNGNTAPRGTSHVTTVSDQSTISYQRPWRLAQVLSSREPIHPQPPGDRNDSFANLRKSILVDDENCVIEVVKRDAISVANVPTDHCRAPLILLLMDPGRKSFELMQLWVDVSLDTVRDVLHAIQINLGDSWRQDYDGVFQVRNNHFTQLIHILNISKYDVQPHELWIAKPWSMAAKNTVAYASGLLNQLKDIGLLCYKTGGETTTTGKNHPKMTESSFLVLTQEAQSRMYVPDGILKHHHACQFLTFSPPFGENPTTRIDVLGGDMDTASQLSDSLCGFSVNSEEQQNPETLQENNGDATRSPSPSECPIPKQSSPLFPIKPMRSSENSSGGMAKVLSALNCSGRRKKVRSRGFSGKMIMQDLTFIESPVGDPLWNLWEEESVAVESVVTDSAPLLFSRHSDDDWL